jgi:hypothetical protein
MSFFWTLSLSNLGGKDTVDIHIDNPPYGLTTQLQKILQEKYDETPS